VTAPEPVSWSAHRSTAKAPTPSASDLNTYLMSGQPIAIGQREKMFKPVHEHYATGDGRRFWIVGLEVDRHWPPLCRAWARTSGWITAVRRRAVTRRQRRRADR